jgi:hypothetical protein
MQIKIAEIDFLPFDVSIAYYDLAQSNEILRRLK